MAYAKLEAITIFLNYYFESVTARSPNFIFHLPRNAFNNEHSSIQRINETTASPFVLLRALREQPPVCNPTLFAS